MSKKLYALLLPVVAVAAIAASGASSASAAEFHWYVCEHVGGGKGTFADSQCVIGLTEGPWALVRSPFEKEGKLTLRQVVTFGKLKFTATNGVTFECKVIDAGNIWNKTEATAGEDNIEAFENYECTSSVCTTLSTEAKGLPWATKLAAGPVDIIKGIEITVTCNGTPLTFKGELSPKVVNETEREPAFAEFTAATGELASGEVKAKVEGRDRIIGFEHGESLAVKAP